MIWTEEVRKYVVERWVDDATYPVLGVPVDGWVFWTSAGSDLEYAQAELAYQRDEYLDFRFRLTYKREIHVFQVVPHA